MRRIVVFLKYPEPGQVKTRLAAELNAAGGADGEAVAARLARRFAEKTLAGAAELGLPVDLSYSPAERGPEIRTWLGARLGPEAVLMPQAGRSLGQRMRGAFAEAFVQGAQRVVLVGTDAPDRPVEMFSEALRRLDGYDVVLGPALDGGYHLLAMRRDGFAPEIFRGIAWGSGRVLVQTLDAVRGLGRTACVLPAWPDIDDLAGLDRYLERHPEERGLLGVSPMPHGGGDGHRSGHSGQGSGA